MAPDAPNTVPQLGQYAGSEPEMYLELSAPTMETFLKVVPRFLDGGLLLIGLGFLNRILRFLAP